MTSYYLNTWNCECLVSGLVPDEVCEGAHLRWFTDGGAAHVKFYLLPCGGSVLIAPALVTWSIEKQKSEYVYIPHAIDPRHEATGVLQGVSKVLIPLVSTFSHLPDDETDDSECCREDRGQHQKLEPPNEAGVVKTAKLGHVLEGLGA